MNAVQELIAKQFPIDTTYIIIICGLRDNLYNPIVIGSLSGEFLKLISAVRNPIVPIIIRTIPIINSIEPIFNGVKINNIRVIKPNIFAILDNVFCNFVHPSSS